MDDNSVLEELKRRLSAEGAMQMTYQAELNQNGMALPPQNTARDHIQAYAQPQEIQLANYSGEETSSQLQHSNFLPQTFYPHNFVSYSAPHGQDASALPSILQPLMSDIAPASYEKSPDSLPLASRYDPQAASPSDELPDEEGSSEDEEEIEEERPGNSVKSAKSLGRRRRNVLPRILRGQRCGHCHTCLNPQMKKACLTMRQRQVEELQKKGELPVSMMTQVGTDRPINKSGALPTVKRKADFQETAARPKRTSVQQDSPEDPFTREITAIANRKGGVELRDLGVLQRMYARETHLERQLVLLTILKQSPDATLREAVKNQRIVADLQSWMQNAVEHKEYRLPSRILDVLDKLPIDLAVLKSTGIGKTLAKLRKSGPEELRKGAEELVAKWRKAVDITPAATTKRPRETDADGGQDGKKSKPGPSAKAPDVPLPPQTSAPAQESQANKPVAVEEVDDTAMFQRKKPQANIAESLSQTKKAHQMKVLDEVQSKQIKQSLDSLHRADKPGKEGSEPGNEGDLQPTPAKEDHTSGSRPAESATNTSHLSLPLGSSRLTGLSTGVTRIGADEPSLNTLSLSAINQPLSAASRAAEAAARVPDPPPMPSKTKLKSVSWKEDESLVLVRIFNGEDPVVAARADAAPREHVAGHQPEVDRPPGFQYAAMREHQDEAAALRRFRQTVTAKEDDEEVEALHPGVQLQHAQPNAQAGHIQSVPHLAPAPLFQAMADWPVSYQGAPLAVNLEASFAMATDGQTMQTASAQEIINRVSSRPALEFSATALIPDSPTEPPQQGDSLPAPQPIIIPCPLDTPLPAQPPPLHQSTSNTDGNTMAVAGQSQASGMQLTGQNMGGSQNVGSVMPPHRFAGPGQLPPAPIMATPNAMMAGQRLPEGQAAAFNGLERGEGRGRGRGRSGRGRDSERGRGGRGGRASEPSSARTPGQRRPPHLTPCKWHFSNSGCRHGDGCKFSHDQSSLET